MSSLATSAVLLFTCDSDARTEPCPSSGPQEVKGPLADPGAWIRVKSLKALASFVGAIDFAETLLKSLRGSDEQKSAFS